MQERYAGDVGDFGKFKLLRHLFNTANYKIGVIWYHFPDEFHNNDGGHTDYVYKESFQDSDIDLCERLRIVLDGERTIDSLEDGGILPNNTVYFSALLNFHNKYTSHNKRDRENRKSERENWLEMAIRCVSDCNVIFLDPDNGLEIASCARISQMRAGKFAYYSEIDRLMKGKRACVIYHHLNRHRTHEEQIHTRLCKIRELIDPTGRVFGLRYRPYSPRAFFILTEKSEENYIRENLNRLIQSPCRQHWDTYYEG